MVDAAGHAPGSRPRVLLLLRHAHALEQKWAEQVGFHGCFVKIAGTDSRSTSARVTVRSSLPRLVSPRMRLQLRGDVRMSTYSCITTPAHLQCFVHDTSRRSSSSSSSSSGNQLWIPVCKAHNGHEGSKQHDQQQHKCDMQALSTQATTCCLIVITS